MTAESLIERVSNGDSPRSVVEATSKVTKLLPSLKKLPGVENEFGRSKNDLLDFVSELLNNSNKLEKIAKIHGVNLNVAKTIDKSINRS